MRLLSRLLPLLAVACAPVVFSQQLDISGITMGMGIDQAKAKIGPGYTYTERDSPDTAIRVVAAIKNRDAWVFQTVNGRLAYASHHLFFEPQSKPNSAETYNRLVQKYGPISIPDQAAWAFTSSGAPLQASPQLVFGCAQGWHAGSFPLSIPGPFYSQLYVPSHLPGPCGISITATVGTDPSKPYLMENFEIAMIDLPTLRAENGRFQAAKQQQETDAINKGKQNKAPF